MQICAGRVIEIWEENGQLAGKIACQLQPVAGQYLLAQSAAGIKDSLPAALFSSGSTAGGFMAAPPLPIDWRPGTELLLKGPTGKGFSLPTGIRRLCLLALDSTPSRLLPLVTQALASRVEAALLCDPQWMDLTFRDLPNALEIDSLEALPAMLAWADFMAIDLPAAFLPELRRCLGLKGGDRLPCAAQALVYTAMPCAGAADCGACAVKGRHGWRLTCKDGPVFDLNELEW